MPLKKKSSKKIVLSVIVPVFNEANSLAYFFPSLKASLDRLNVSYEIIVIDDGSTDKSYNIIQNFSFVKVFKHNENKGYGSALKTGLRYSFGEWILIIDADSTYKPEQITRLWTNRNGFDMVIGSRTGKNVNIPILRIPAKIFLKLLSEYVVGKPIPDLNSGMRLFRKSVCKKYLNLYPNGFSFTTTMTIALMSNGYSVNFVPIDYEKRIGNSTIRPFHDFIGFIRLVLKLMLYFRPLKIFFPLGLMFFIFTLFVLFYDFTFSRRIVHDTTIIFSFFISINTIMLGLIADMIARK